ncbi:Filamentous hemagglutinin, intein-containing [Pseudomonas syringae pv. aptata]|uniref:Filamentous hemagglutinin, intein-containing n=1 Tax=Pseudomonas syringae pv. aptata TaxID=83167 RepID=A0A3M3XQ63_PSEAP|nr:Filamentous hemagglutinin, intein-containing [Pseudomonas syringae]RMO71443.1 Filamentous hemagglutinin, intein-containing [Pseudomonas syringae pv. aptata]
MQGLPSSSFASKPQKCLIETDPVLTQLKQFMSSDYLLAGLGYDPEVSAKRLGDGLYEQRLVQQAVVARTGQAFIDGQTSNEAQFKYLDPAQGLSVRGINYWRNPTSRRVG